MIRPCTDQKKKCFAGHVLDAGGEPYCLAKCWTVDSYDIDIYKPKVHIFLLCSCQNTVLYIYYVIITFGDFIMT